MFPTKEEKDKQGFYHTHDLFDLLSEMKDIKSIIQNNSNEFKFRCQNYYGHRPTYEEDHNTQGAISFLFFEEGMNMLDIVPFSRVAANH